MVQLTLSSGECQNDRLLLREEGLAGLQERGEWSVAVAGFGPTCSQHLHIDIGVLIVALHVDGLTSFVPDGSVQAVLEASRERAENGLQRCLSGGQGRSRDPDGCAATMCGRQYFVLYVHYIVCTPLRF